MTERVIKAENPQWGTLAGGIKKTDYSSESEAVIKAKASSLQDNGSPVDKKAFISDLFQSAESLSINKKVSVNDQNAEGKQYRTLLRTAVDVLYSLPQDEIHDTLFSLLQTRSGGTNTFQDFQAAMTAETIYRQLMR